MECPGHNTIAELVCRALDPPVAAQIEGHVADCAPCRRAVGALARSSLGRIAGATPSTAATMPGFAPDPVPLRAGATIDRYRVLELLGAGGMGIVYAAHDPQLDRAVALKLLLPELARDPDAARTLLLSEAQAMARLRHPNLVTVHDVGTDGDRVFIAMELIAGQTLRGWLSKPRPWPEVRRVMVAAGRGLAAAHDAGLVHRDFKPENVLCGAGGQVCVSDFGLALPAGVEPSHVGGTPAYMAPEQRRGAVPDPRADQYSFCVVLAEAVPRPPAWLARLCARGRADDPTARFPSMHALLDELVRDRGRVRRRLAVAAAAVAVTAGVVALSPRPAAAPTRCRGAAAQLAPVWNPARRAEVQRALLATGVPFAADTWRRVERALDAHAGGWIAMHVETCEATAVHHTQSPELLDRRMACLASRKAELDAAVSGLAATDRVTIRDALRLTGELPALASCAQPGGLADLPAATAAAAPQLEQLRGDVARAAVLERRGKLAEAIAAATAAAATAVRLGAGALEAEARFTLAVAHHTSGDLAAARASHQAAIRAAARSGHAGLEARALAALALLTASSTDGSVAREYAGHAVAIVERIGAEPLLEATVRQAHARVLYGIDWDQAVAELEAGERRLADAARTLPIAAVQEARIPFIELRADLEIDTLASLVRTTAALGLAQSVYGPDHPRVAKVLADMAELAMRGGDVEQALGYGARVAEILAPYPGHDATVRAVEAATEADPARRATLLEAVRRATEAQAGPRSPRVAFVLADLGDTYDELERYRDSLASYDRAIAIWDEAGTGTYEMLVFTILAKADAHGKLDQWDAAAVAQERALTLARRGGMREMSVSVAEISRAEILFHQRRFAEALDVLASHGPVLRRLLPGDPGLVVLDFLEAACAWELDRQRPAALRRARTAYRAYRQVPDLEPYTLRQIEAWLASAQ